MSVQAQAADGTIHEFPDGTDQAVVDRVMKTYATQQPTQNPTTGKNAVVATPANRGAYKPDTAPGVANQNVNLAKAADNSAPAPTGGTEFRTNRSGAPIPVTREERETKSQQQTLPGNKQAVYDMLSNDGERAAFLRKSYGDNIGKDANGLYVSLPNGRKMYPKSGIVSSVASNVLPFAGGTLGAMGAGALAAPTGPGAIAAGVGGAAAGTALGQGANDAIVKALGFYDRTPQQEAEGLGGAALGGAIGEGAGRALPEAGLAAARGVGKFLGIDPEKAAVARGIGDAVAPASYMDAPRLQRFVDISRGLGKDPLAKSEQKFAQGQTGEMLQRSGMTPEAAAAETERLKTAKPSLEPAGQELKTAATQDYAAQRTALEQGVNRIREEAKARGAAPGQQLATDKAAAEKELAGHQAEMQKTINEGFDAIHKFRGDNQPGALAVDLSAKVQDLRQRVSGVAEKMYDAADKASGGKTIPIHALDDAAEKFLADVPKDIRDNQPSLIRKLSDLSSGSMSFGQLHYLRSQLRDLGYSDKLTPDFKRGGYKYLSGIVDDLIHDQGNAPEVKAAAAKLDKADKFYADNMKQFRNKELQGIVDDVRDGLPMDARKVARTIVQSGESATLARIQKIGGPAITKRIASADLSDVIAESKYPLSEDIDPKRFLSEIDQRYRSGTLGNLYGPGQANQIATLARRLAARDGIIPVNGLTPDKFVESLKAANAASDRLSALAKEDPIKMMDAATAEGEQQVKALMRDFKERMSPSQDMLSFLRKPELLADKAATSILNNEQLLKAAVARYGEDSKAITVLRQKALEKMMAPVMQGQGGATLATDLEKLTEGQQKILFPNGMDADLRKIATGLKTITGPGSDMSAGLAAGTIKDKPIRQFLPLYYYRTGGAWLVTHPNFVKAIAADFSDKSTVAKGVKKLRAVMALSTRAAVAGSGVESPENEGTPEGRSNIPDADQQPQDKSGWRQYIQDGSNDWRQYAK